MYLYSPSFDTYLKRFAVQLSNSNKEFSVDSYSLIDLTELGLDTLTAQQIYERYNQYFDLIANGQSVCLLADEYQNCSGKVIRRLGEVDLGTLNWAYDSGVPRFRTYSIPSDMKLPSTQAQAPNCFCPRYKTSSALNAQGVNGFLSSQLTWLQITDINFTSATDFKNAMSGVKLIYELVTPTTEQHGTIMVSRNSNKAVSDNGIELGMERK